MSLRRRLHPPPSLRPPPHCDRCPAYLDLSLCSQRARRAPYRARCLTRPRTQTRRRSRTRKHIRSSRCAHRDRASESRILSACLPSLTLTIHAYIIGFRRDSFPHARMHRRRHRRRRWTMALRHLRTEHDCISSRARRTPVRICAFRRASRVTFVARSTARVRGTSVCSVRVSTFFSLSLLVEED